MNSSSVRLLWALSAALLLHGTVLLMHLQHRIVPPVPEPTRRVTVSLTTLRIESDKADNRWQHVVELPQGTPVVSPLEQSVTSALAVQNTVRKVQQTTKLLMHPPVPRTDRKPAAAPAAGSAVFLEDPLPYPVSESISTKQKSRVTPEAVVVKAVPIYRNNPPPKYPPLARHRGQEGTVLVEALVSSTGRVIETRIARSSKYTLLDLSARKAVNSWKFIAGTENGRSIEMRVMVPVHFTLQ